MKAMSPAVPREPGRVTEKSPDAFRTISEVAEELDLPQHVLRFWETRFAQIKPLKRGGGRRYYRPDDLDLLKGIRQLLYGQGYTIKGVQRILKEDGIRFVQSVGRGEQAVEAPPAGERGPGPQAIGEDPAEAGAASPARDERGQAHPTAMGSGQVAFGQADIERLKLALDELLECERVLAALKADSGDE